jgi:hypothetical protein
MSMIFSNLEKAREKQRQIIQQSGEAAPAREATRKAARDRDPARDKNREKPRDKVTPSSRERSRGGSRSPLSRDTIQEFSFRLRDELKVKVQAEVPHTWQQELDDLARELRVKKLELYRFILGEFLGKVKRQEGKEKRAHNR